jgi:hypothetical protein
MVSFYDKYLYLERQNKLIKITNIYACVSKRSLANTKSSLDQISNDIQVINNNLTNRRDK